MGTLPPFLAICLEIGNEVIYASNVNEGSRKGNIMFFEDGQLINPNAKFIVENAINDGLVHIKCCYNNKYLCRASNEDYHLCVAGNEAVEDSTNWKCTLFRHRWSSSEESHFSLTHIQSGKGVLAKPTPDSVGNTTTHILWVDHEENNSTTFVALDFSTIVKLPRFVVFKWCTNDRYARAYLVTNGGEDSVYNRPDTLNKFAPAALYEILPKRGDANMIKANFNGKFWISDPTDSSIRAEWEDPTRNQRNILFKATQFPNYNNNVVSLIGLKSLPQIKAYVAHPPGSLTLRTSYDLPAIETQTRVEEGVVRRSINIIEFRVEDARIYSVSDTMLVFASIETEENRGDTTIEVSIKLPYQITQTTSWDRLKTVTDQLEETKSMTTFVSSGVPELVSDSEIRVRTSREWEYSGGEFGWGERVEQVKEDEYSLLIEVMPMTKKIVTVIGKLGQCDVPFSYIQTDKVFNEETVTFNHDDGLFSGTNAFDVMARIVEQQLS